LRRAVEHSGVAQGATFDMRRAPNGKPWLDFRPVRMIGFSNSYTRLNGRKIALIALLPDHEIGVDLEVWPKTEADPAFLETVAATEDADVVEWLGQTGYNAGIALWVIKEAALKCSGEVMVDPRNLAVTLQRNGLYRVSNSKRAGAPHPEINVELLTLTSVPELAPVMIVGLATPFDGLTKKLPWQTFEFSEPGWKIGKIRD
jgi:phosphopantetheinyl transferase